MLRVLAAVILMVAMLAVAAFALTPLGFLLALEASAPWRGQDCHPAIVERWLPWEGLFIDGGCVP